MTEDRRRIKRRFLMYYSRIYDTGAEKLLGHLGDITSGGLMVISEERLPVGSSWQLKLELSNEIAPEPFLRFTARSVWCEQDVNPSVYNTGFEIEEMPVEGMEIIQRIVDTYGFRDNG